MEQELPPKNLILVINWMVWHISFCHSPLKVHSKQSQKYLELGRAQVPSAARAPAQETFYFKDNLKFKSLIKLIKNLFIIRDNLKSKSSDENVRPISFYHSSLKVHPKRKLNYLKSQKILISS